MAREFRTYQNLIRLYDKYRAGTFGAAVPELPLSIRDVINPNQSDIQKMQKIIDEAKRRRAKLVKQQLKKSKGYIVRKKKSSPKTQAEYRRLRKNYSSMKSYYKKKGIKLPNLPRNIKNPTANDVKQIGKQIESIKQTIKDNITPENIVYKAILRIVNTGKASGSQWVRFKAIKIENTVVQEYRDNPESAAERWEAQFERLDDIVSRFINNNYQTHPDWDNADDPVMTTEAWDLIDEVLLVQHQSNYFQMTSGIERTQNEEEEQTINS